MPYQIGIYKSKPRHNGAMRIARIEAANDPKYDGAYIWAWDEDGPRRKPGDERPEITFPLKQGYALFPFFDKPKEKIPYHTNFCGPSGSGKSTALGKVLDQMIHIMPKPDAEDEETGRIRGRVIVFSGAPADEPIDRARRGFESIRVDLEDPELFELRKKEQIEHFLSNNIVVYDDIERLGGKVGKFLLDHRSYMLECARHYGSHVMTISHDPKGSHITKVVNQETTGLFCFPLHSPGEKLRSYMKVYYSLTPEQIERIFMLESRWVYIRRVYPRWIIYETGMYLID